MVTYESVPKLRRHRRRVRALLNSAAHVFLHTVCGVPTNGVAFRTRMGCRRLPGVRRGAAPVMCAPGDGDAGGGLGAFRQATSLCRTRERCDFAYCSYFRGRTPPRKQNN